MKSNEKGLFVVLEGIDGSGKTTTLQRVAEELTNRGHDVVSTFEPGDSKLGSELRRLIMDNSNLTTEAELFLFLADRAEHVGKVIKPALNRGAIVLCDRYIMSTLVYQGLNSSLDLSLSYIKDLNTLATGELVPDITFLFDIDPRIALERKERQGLRNRLDSSSLPYLTQLREDFTSVKNFLEEEEEYITYINANNPQTSIVEVIVEDICSIIDSRKYLESMLESDPPVHIGDHINDSINDIISQDVNSISDDIDTIIDDSIGDNIGEKNTLNQDENILSPNVNNISQNISIIGNPVNTIGTNVIEC